MGAAASLVETLAARLRPRELAANSAWWASYTDASVEHEAARVAGEVALRDALADPAAFAEVRGTLGAADGRGAGADAAIRRQLEVLHDRMLPQQLAPDLRRRLVEAEAAAESGFAAFRGTIDGEPADDNAILAVLRTSDDSAERRAAWAASKQVGAELGSSVRELAELRNEAARALGHRDHFALALAAGELDEDRLLQTLDEVDRATAAPFAAWKAELDARRAERFGVDPGQLAPWHYDDPFFQEPPAADAVDLDPVLGGLDLEAATLRTYEGLGVDLAPVLRNSDLQPRDGKSQHAFCIDLDREGDVRVLSNNVAGERWTETMLHEFGHALYDRSLDPGVPWLLREAAHPLTTEGVAMLCGRLVRDPEWLARVAGVPPGDVASLAPRLAAARRGALLVFARWVLVMTHFERSLYADPGADHGNRWWQLVAHFQGIARPAGSAPEVEDAWASKVHLVAAPVYYQNYLYGELFASQVQDLLRTRAGGIVDRPAAGRVLVEEIAAPGRSLRWDRLTARATGAPLSASHLAAELAA